MRAPGIRFALHYGAFFLAFGAALPYLPVWMSGRGLSPEMIGLAAAGGMIGRMLVSPLGAAWMDAATRRRDALIGFSWAGLAGYLLLAPASGEILIMALVMLAGAAYGGQTPLIDAFAIRSARTDGFAFGRVRAAGSATFVIGNLAGGALVGVYGGEAALAWVIGGAALAVGTAYLLPAGERAPEPGDAGGGPNGWLRMFTAPVILAVLASGLIQSAHGFNYAFSTLAWADQGVSAPVIGALWGTAVLAEIIFLWVSGRVLTRVPATALLIVGGAASIVRWALLALSPPVWVLFLLQIMHAATFTATYLGFLRFAADHVPDRYAARTQAVHAALAGGVLLAATTAVSGLLFERYGAGGFAGMIVPAALGTVCGLALAVALRSPEQRKAP